MKTNIELEYISPQKKIPIKDDPVHHEMRIPIRGRNYSGDHVYFINYTIRVNKNGETIKKTVTWEYSHTEVRILVDMGG